VGFLLRGGSGAGPAAGVGGVAEGRGGLGGAGGFVGVPLPLVALVLAGLEIVLLPSGGCTYEAAHIFAVIPYAAASQWKRLVLGFLGMG
jgi:hypothetical protein